MDSGSSANTPQDLAMPTSAHDPNTNFEEVPPTILLDSNRFTCEICLQGFPRKQNLSLHQRVHNLPFTLKTRTPNDLVPRKKYLCPEPTCVHHNRSHAIGDFGGLKKHYLRKHSTDKVHKCDTCSKAYSVHADLKAHSKICAGKNHGSRFSRTNLITAHQENCDAPEQVGAFRTVSHPQTLGVRDNTNTIYSNESSSSLIGPQISCIQNQSSSYPLTTPYQSGASPSSLVTYPSVGEIPPFISTTSSSQYQLGYYADKSIDKIPSHNLNHENTNIQGDSGNAYGTMEGRNSFFDGDFMHGTSSSRNLTPARHNPGLQEMLNPVTAISDAGGYVQGGYNGYRVGGGPFEYSGGINMFSYQQQQQPLQNVNYDPSGSFNLTQASHNLGLNGMFNPMTGSSNMGSYQKSGYNDYGVSRESTGYIGGNETFNFQQYQQQSPLQNVNPEYMNVHGDLGNIIGTREGTEMFNFQQYQQHQPIQNINPEYRNVHGGLGNINGTGEGSSNAGHYNQGGYKGYVP